MEESLAPFGGTFKPGKMHRDLYSLWARGNWGLVITGRFKTITSQAIIAVLFF
jgi:2,4-dienoyl-CoA reductase-like NADH-dependent reductase (Old Yellow Enzyme family)